MPAIRAKGPKNDVTVSGHVRDASAMAWVNFARYIFDEVVLASQENNKIKDRSKSVFKAVVKHFFPSTKPYSSSSIEVD